MEINKRKKDNNRAARLYLKTLRLLIKLKFITVTVCYILKYTFYMLIFRIDYDDYLKAINNSSRAVVNTSLFTDFLILLIKLLLSL
jgi:hypothetical protein